MSELYTLETLLLSHGATLRGETRPTTMITSRVPDNVHDAGSRPLDAPANVLDIGKGVLWVRGENPEIRKLPKQKKQLTQGRSNVLGFVRSLPFSSRSMSSYRSQSRQKWLALDAR